MLWTDVMGLSKSIPAADVSVLFQQLESVTVGKPWTQTGVNAGASGALLHATDYKLLILITAFVSVDLW